ncbi:slc25a42, partial [Symbiodinium pilosum]
LSDTMAARALILTVLPLLVACQSGGNLRGSPSIDSLMACTGTGSLPDGPVCYGGSLLSETFNIHVISHDGQVGIVDMKAEGPMAGECEGANFQNNDNVITVENDHGCGLTKYEYTVEYCPDQDHVIVNLAKPYVVRVVLDSQACPAAGEV